MKSKVKVRRFERNPIFMASDIPWPCNFAYNPGVIFDNDAGVFCMLFRAALRFDLLESCLGLALSADGDKFFPLSEPVIKYGVNEFCLLGVEDSRIVQWVDGYKYIFATAFSSEQEKIGIWRTKNFLDFQWQGAPFMHKDRNASIFPEPIGGWAYLVHRKQPHIWVSRTKEITLSGGWQDSKIIVRAEQLYRHPEKKVLPEKIGLAGPPIKAPKGWLVIMHVVHRWDQDGSRRAFFLNREYSLGYMVLDLVDPTKVIYIHPEPILRPEEDYEMLGRFPCVVFSCANIDKKNEDFLRIYYGGADTVVCGGRLEKKDIMIHDEHLYF